MSCDQVQIKYQGDAQTVLFTFPFEYERQSDIKVAFQDRVTKLYSDVPQDDANHPWSFENATTVRFNDAPQGLDVFVIYRKTAINPAVFSPGSAIRAKDLNYNFDELKLSLEELRCADENLYTFILESALTGDDITKLQQQIDGNVPNDDDHVMSNAVSIERYDVLTSPNPPENSSQNGKWWVDTQDERIAYYNQDIGAWVDTSQTGPPGPPGPQGSGIQFKGVVDATQPDSSPDTAQPGDMYYNTGTGVGDDSWGPSVLGANIEPGDRIIRNDQSRWDVLEPDNGGQELWAQGVGEIVPINPGNGLNINGYIRTGTNIRFANGTVQITAGGVEITNGVPAGDSEGNMWFNPDTGELSIRANGAWVSSGGGINGWAVEHDNVISADYTIPSDKNVINAGPLEMTDGTVVTVSDGATWRIV